MATKIFTSDELYDLVSAEYSALQLEKKGWTSGWYDFASEEQYEKKIRALGKYEDKFENDLKGTAIVVSEYFEQLSSLRESDFDTEEEFWEERSFIEEMILQRIRYCLELYCLDL